MNESLVIPPVSMSLIVTDKCTAECENCCFGCKRSNRNRLTWTEIKGYIDQATKEFNTIKLLIITGGECFTIGKDLDKTIEYASQMGLAVRVITNAYWAKSFKVAYTKLKKLQELGLSEINISTGDEHQQWIKFDNIINTLIATIKLDMLIAVNIETAPNTSFNASMIHSDIRIKKYEIKNNPKVHILNGKWMYFKRPAHDQITSKNDCHCETGANSNVRCTSLFKDVIVSSQHHMYACCGLTCAHIPYLYIGNTQKHKLADLYNRSFDDFIKIWLYTEGPSKILKFVQTKLGYEAEDTSEWHICQSCVELLSNPKYQQCLKDNYTDVMSNVMIKYLLLKQKLSTIHSNINYNEGEKQTKS